MPGYIRKGDMNVEEKKTSVTRSKIHANVVESELTHITNRYET